MRLICWVWWWCCLVLAAESMHCVPPIESILRRRSFGFWWSFSPVQCLFGPLWQTWSWTATYGSLNSSDLQPSPCRWVLFLPHVSFVVASTSTFWVGGGAAVAFSTDLIYTPMPRYRSNVSHCHTMRYTQCNRKTSNLNRRSTHRCVWYTYIVHRLRLHHVTGMC